MSACGVCPRTWLAIATRPRGLSGEIHSPQLGGSQSYFLPLE
jgi:hypothetical protein